MAHWETRGYERQVLPSGRNILKRSRSSAQRIDSYAKALFHVMSAHEISRSTERLKQSPDCLAHVICSLNFNPGGPLLQATLAFTSVKRRWPTAFVLFDHLRLTEPLV